MIATVGHGSVLLALALAGWGVLVPWLGARSSRPALVASVRAAMLGQFVLVTGASLALIYALVTTDFSLKGQVPQPLGHYDAWRKTMGVGCDG
jgi:cytochrome c biogenesis factor